MASLRTLIFPVFLLGLATASQAQDQFPDPTNFVPGMVVAPTALPPLGQRTPDALILARPDVQADLRLSASQKRRFARFGAAVSDSQARLDDAANVTNANVFSPLPMEAIESYVDNQAEVDDEVERGIASILNGSQRTRFTQIRLQLDGPMAFLRPDLLEKLDIDDDQADAIRTVVSTARQEIVENPQFPLTTRDVPRRDGRRAPTVTEDESTLEEQLARARVSNDRTRQAALGQIAQILRKSQWQAYIRLRGSPFVQAGAAPKPSTASPPSITPKARRPRPESEQD